MDRNKILIVSPAVYETIHSGTGMRAHCQAVHLSHRYDVTVATEGVVYEVRNGIFSEPAGARLEYGERSNALAKSLMTGRHYQFELWRASEWIMPDWHGYDLVVLHYAALLDLLKDSEHSDCEVILDTHNSDREYYGSIAEASGHFVKRKLIELQAKKSERNIVRYSKRIQAVVSVSESDAAWATQFCDDETEQIIMPNNLFPARQLDWNGEQTLVYVGSLHTEMNLQALRWFISSLWPKIRETYPQVSVLLAGRHPGAELKTLARESGIEILENPARIEMAYERALALLVPALSGSGGKIKVCEALSFGVPVLTTEIGLVGQPAEISKLCLQADSPDEWVSRVGDLLRDYAPRSPSWEASVVTAIDSTYIGNTIVKIERYVNKGKVIRGSFVREAVG